MGRMGSCGEPAADGVTRLVRPPSGGWRPGRRTATVAALGLLLGAAPGVALGQPAEAAAMSAAAGVRRVLLLAGAEGGTYLRMAQDLERLFAGEAREAGLDVVAVPTSGALLNAVALARHPTIPFAMVQTDVLYYLALWARETSEARRAADHLKIVLPLHLEGVHLVARPHVREVGDLTGLRVAIGEAGSGTQTTAIVLMSLLRVEPRETLTMRTDEALPALRRGELDAFFLVAGVPTPVLQQEAPGSGISLVPIGLDTVPAAELPFPYYQSRVIPGGTYAWQPGPVPTVALRSVIAAMTDQPCHDVQRLFRGVERHVAWLRRQGHPAWRDPGAGDAGFLSRLLETPGLARSVSPCVVPLLRR